MAVSPDFDRLHPFGVDKKDFNKVLFDLQSAVSAGYYREDTPDEIEAGGMTSLREIFPLGPEVLFTVGELESLEAIDTRGDIAPRIAGFLEAGKINSSQTTIYVSDPRQH